MSKKRFNKVNAGMVFLLVLVLISGGFFKFVFADACRNLGGVMYVLKYVLKDSATQNNYATTVRCWLYEKRAFSVSSSFRNDLVSYSEGYCPTSLDTITHNSNAFSESYHGYFYIGSVILKKNRSEFFYDAEIEPPDGFDVDSSYDSWIASKLKLVEVSSDG